jgi:hypothetical protein
MSLVSKLERHLGRFAIPNLSLYLVFGQVTVYLSIMIGRLDPEWLVFVPRNVLLGQWWRVFTFLLLPPSSNLLFIGFAWYMFFLMGSALEEFWGAFRFNVFIFLGTALTLGASFLRPAIPVSNEFVFSSVFLAFAYLNPEFELLLFFILPVKIKWLALLDWARFGYACIVGGWSIRLSVIAAVGNFLLFFGRDLWLAAGMRRRAMAHAADRAGSAGKPEGARHRCRICGKTEVSNPELDFRYCSKCAGDECYCSDHIRNHEHVVAPGAPPPKP